MEWRYLKTGKVRHTMRQYNLYSTSLEESTCGILAGINSWYGTGTQDEYDKAANMPVCKRCAAYLPK